MSTLLLGLRGAGVPLTDSDVIVGTSAGSVVGVWLTAEPEGLAKVPALMQERAAWHARNASAGRQDTGVFEKLAAQGQQGAGSAGQGGGPAEPASRFATSAIPPISVEQADDLWRAMLPDGAWAPRLRMVSVNTGTGQARAWSARDGISVAVGVACSTAAPGIAPPVAVDGGVWVDGGVRSGTNADLIVELGADDAGANATGPGRVLIVAPMASGDIASEEALLIERGYRVRVIVADRFYNSPADMIDARFIEAGATAGAKQARDLAPELLTWWQS
jgi:NTE family protein